jgi:RNA polymerase sigma factor (sigma-70 family)
MPYSNDSDGALFQQLRPRLKAISRRIVGSEEEAEDVVQDCFFKWRVAEQAALSAPAAWLTTVVRHQSIDRLRKRARDALAAHGAMELLPAVPAAAPDEGLLRRAALGEALACLLARLSPAERLALVLHEAFECGHADIAAALGTNAVNARQYLARARRKLRQAGLETPPQEKLCRELIRRFQAAINGMDLPAMVSLLGDEQPLAVCASPQPGLRRGACANDRAYRLAMAA